MNKKQSRLAYYRDTLGFDGSTAVPFTKEIHIKCSQCEALAINGVATHEHGCPNWAAAKRREQEEDEEQEEGIDPLCPTNECRGTCDPEAHGMFGA